jgi:hypothetical protein
MIKAAEIEIFEIERREKTFYYRALTLKIEGQRISDAGKILLNYTLGELKNDSDIFGELMTVESQVDEANRAIESANSIIHKTLARTDWLDLN